MRDHHPQPEDRISQTFPLAGGDEKRAEFRKYTGTWQGRLWADNLKLAIGRIVLGLFERTWFCPIMHIHDELVFELPQNRLKEAIFYIKNCMETKPFEEFLISIVAETAHGKHFGELEKFDGYEE
jgi:hypothetical protein